MVRADARRNRDQLVAAAREVLTEGGDARIETIAKRAGVGVGTLYRHFPDREALVTAVYGAELNDVCDEAEALLAEPGHDPVVALRIWLDRYAAFIGAKRGMAEALRAARDSGAIRQSETRARVTAAVAGLLAAGAATGQVRADVDAEDVTAALLGVFLTTRDSPDPEQAGRLLDLLVAGLRAPQ